MRIHRHAMCRCRRIVERHRGSITTQSEPGKGATFVGGTGYQYGDTDFIEYSERLYAGFSARLSDAGPVSVGGAQLYPKSAVSTVSPAGRASEGDRSASST